MRSFVRRRNFTRHVRDVLVCGLAFSLASASAQSPAVPYYFTTLAGLASAGANDGPASTARFYHPEGIAVDGSGNIYVADTGNFTVRRISSSGIVATVAGQAGVPGSNDGPASLARLQWPTGVSADRAGSLYVADDTMIRRIGADGQVSTFAGVPFDSTAPAPLRDGLGREARFNQLTALTIDAGGTLFASDTGNYAIRQITPSAVVTTLAGSGSRGANDGTGRNAGFGYPLGIAVDLAGSVYVADGGNSTIRKIASGGSTTTLAGRPGVFGTADGAGPASAFNFPEGLAVDSAGKIYVSDSLSETIRAITPTGEVSTLAGNPPQVANGSFITGTIGDADGFGAAATFRGPGALATDQAGNIYVADGPSNVIRKITPAGAVSTVAGVAPSRSTGSANGPGASARFNRPQGVAVAPNGTCYVADTYNQIIRKIAPDGNVSTFAGTANVIGYDDGAGTTAKFNTPAAVATDSQGNVFVADSGNHLIRRVTPDGVVATLAGTPGVAGTKDGQGPAAEFGRISGLAVDPAGNVYVAGGHYIRKIDPLGTVSTLTVALAPADSIFSDVAVDRSGTLYATVPEYGYLLKIPAAAGNGSDPFLPLRMAGENNGGFDPAHLCVDDKGAVYVVNHGSAASSIGLVGPDGRVTLIATSVLHQYTPARQDGLGPDIGFAGAAGIGVDMAGALYIACPNDNTIHKGVHAAAPAILTQPQSSTVAAGASVQFSVAAAAVPAPAYQWQYNGAPLAGATAAVYGFTAANTRDAGQYTVVVSNELGSVVSSQAVLTVTGGSPPSPSSGAGSAGGGALSAWFIGALGALLGARFATRRRLAILG